jgi:uncharacterized membrane protein YfcA
MTILTILALLAAGLCAGALTTIAGLGGGILLIAGLSMVWAPAVVLAVTAPALFVGNASRVAFLRREVAWKMVGVFALTGVPTALAASLLAAWAPTGVVKLAIASLLVAFVAHEVLKPKRAAQAASTSPWLTPAAGAIAGTVSGLTGGAGFVATPLLERQGLTPTRVVATSSACMGLLHLTKGLGFSLGAVLTPALLPAAAVLAIGIMAGNAVGTRVISRLSRDAFRKLLLGALGLAAIELFATAF